MSELAPADPEAPYPSLTVLHDAAQQSFGDPHDPSVLEVQRSLLWGILQKAIDGQVNSRAQAAIFNYGEIVDYLWFQPSDAPLPRGLARSEAIYIPGRPDYKDLCFGLTDLGPDTFERITGLLRQQGLDQLLLARSSSYARNGTFGSAVESFVSATPAAKWLQAFSAQAGQLPNRLTPWERANREAMIYGGAAQDLRRQFLSVTSRHLRTSPRLQIPIRRQMYPLDEERGQRPTHAPTHQAAVQLAKLATAELIDRSPKLARLAERLVYRSSTEMLSFIGADGRAVGESIGLDEVAERIQQTYGYAPRLGGDEMSREVYAQSLTAAYSAATGNGSSSDIYASSVRTVADDYSTLLRRGLGLRGGEDVLRAASILKQYRNDLPLQTPVGVEDDGGLGIVFVGGERKVVEVLPQGEEGDRARAFGRALGKGRAPGRSPEVRAESAVQGLLRSARRFLALPEESPDEVVFGRLQALGHKDPIVDCLGVLYQAQDELAQAGQLSAGLSAQVRRQIAYVEGLEALGDGPGADWYYTSPKEMAVVLRRALEPLARLVGVAK